MVFYIRGGSSCFDLEYTLLKKFSYAGGYSFFHRILLNMIISIIHLLFKRFKFDSSGDYTEAKAYYLITGTILIRKTFKNEQSPNLQKLDYGNLYYCSKLDDIIRHF